MNDFNISIIEGVECYEKDGVAYLKLETVARGLGFTQEKNGTEYVKWERVREYISDIGFSPEVGKYDFIPENVFYRLAMKAKNAVAEAFQAKVADEIIPAIRRTGSYSALNAPKDYPSALRALADEWEKNHALEQENAEQRMMLAEYSPKASYYDVVLQTPDLISISKIAKDYGKSAQWMNRYLKEKGIQYKQGNVWLLRQNYAEQGYTKSRTDVYTTGDGETHSKLHTYWNQKGRLFIYDTLKQDGILPLIEREDRYAN